MVAHEIILSVQRLVKKYGKDLTNSTWDIIMEILEIILKQIEVLKGECNLQAYCSLKERTTQNAF